MDNDERLRRLRLMLAQVSGGALETLSPPAAALESVGLAQAHADDGLDKMASGRLEQIAPAEQFALEAIVLPKIRPVVFITGNSSYEDLPDPWQSLNAPALKSRFAALFPCIGRVELPNSPLVPFAGTAFIAGDGRLVTNRHVAQLFAQGLGTNISYRPGGSAIDFKRQRDTPDSDSHPLVVEGVELIHPYWDMAILKVAGLPSGQMLKLSVKPPEELVDRDVIVVGYPAQDVRNDAQVQAEVFKGIYNVKRLQPGKVRPRARIQSFETLVNAMTHDASTLGGNSGSAVIDVSTGEVVSLHFGGIYLKANYVVPMYELARDRRVAPKLNFDGQIVPTTDFDAAWSRTQSRETPAPAPKPSPVTPAATPSVTTTTATTTTATAATASTTFQIPVTVSVTVGSLVAAGEAVVSEGVEEAVVVDQDYSTRPGYNPDFLDGLAVPLPKISAAMKKDTAMVHDEDRKHGDPFELTYFNYSVYMNKKRRTAWFSAANVDGEQRPSIGKRSGDRWYRDPRIDPSEQLDQKAFEPGIDRGHLTRREDTAWGPDPATALASNNDTFHFTNCSLQASAFNRGKDRWQGLEQFLLEQHAKKDHRRMTVITGPVFSDKDPVYRNEKMAQSVRCPLEFWKVCVLIRQDGSPSATAFILGQDDIQSLPGFEEAFDVGATQLTIAELEQKTGLSFGSLKRFDHFAQSHVPGTLETTAGLEAAPPRRPIRHPGDIVVGPMASPGTEAVAEAAAQPRKIEHVIVLMLENRSFDHLFGFADAPAGQTIDNLLSMHSPPSSLLDPSKPRSSSNPAFDVSQPAPFAVSDKEGPSHSFNAVNTQLSGSKQGPSAANPARNNGFALNYSNSLRAHSHHVTRDQINEVMQCFSPDQLPAINQLAREFCLCDRWHCEVPGPTMPNRMFVHAATSEGYVHNDFKRSYTSKTVYELVQEKGLTWGVYFHDLNEIMQFQALEQTPDTFRRFDRWAQDTADGNIPNYVFICPRFLNGRHGGESQPANSQHAPEDARFADHLIADVYDALAANQELFRKSVLIVTYDEHGGFYDHVVPGPTVNPDGQNSPNPDDDPKFGSFKFAFDRIGLRVPTIIASPWIGKGTVEHRLLQHTSIIKTATEIFGLAGPINRRDASAASFADLFGQLPQPRPASDMPTALSRPALAGVTESVVAGVPVDLSSEPLDELTEDWAKAMPLHIRGALATEAVAGAEPDVQTQGEASDMVEARLRAAGL